MILDEYGKKVSSKPIVDIPLLMTSKELLDRLQRHEDVFLRLIKLQNFRESLPDKLKPKPQKISLRRPKPFNPRDFED